MTKILVIDDQIEMRQIMKSLLEEQGYEVEIAQDGNDGLNRHRENPANLIITDLHMPEKDGLETIKELRDAKEDVKIIAMSGANTFMVDTNLDTSERMGADKAFSKPFDHDEFNQAVRDLIEGS
jgi:DNA-binding response OmpR family regulator